MWDKRVILGWLVLAVIVISYELWTNFNGSPKTPTLTDVTLHYMRAYIIMPFLTWLWMHFALNYAEASSLAPMIHRLPHWFLWVFGA